MAGGPDLDPTRTAVVTIDLHRGHLDPDVATMPLAADAAEAVLERNRVLLEGARRAGVTVVHVVTRYRTAEEATSNPFWGRLVGTDASRAAVSIHQVEPTPGTELMPGLLDPTDVVVDTKKRYDCFLGTDLDLVLRTRGLDTLLLTGVNTNSCVLATTMAACTRDYAAVVVSDAVDSMDGPDLHAAALRCIEQAFGWVLTTDEVLGELGVGAAPSVR